MNQPQFWCIFCETKTVRVFTNQLLDTSGQHIVVTTFKGCIKCGLGVIVKVEEGKVK